MSLKVTGRIRETESGLGVPNLVVRVLDKDEKYDDVLGDVITDSEGKFSLSYEKIDFEEEAAPDLYLIVKTPDRERVLYTSEKSVRWEADVEEHFEVTIPRATLGELSPKFDWEKLQDRISSILDQLNANQDLALAAAANPLFALEELGYEIDPQARSEIEDRLRFDPPTVIRLRALREEIFEHAGHPFDLNSAEELKRVLFEELDLSVSGRQQNQSQQQPEELPDTSPLPPQLSWTEKVEDPLEVLRDAHLIMEPLLEYRRLEASKPRLAPRPLYEEVRQGKRRLPIHNIRGRLKSQPNPQ